MHKFFHSIVAMPLSSDEGYEGGVWWEKKEEISVVGGGGGGGGGS